LPRDNSVYLNDIIRSIDLIIKYTENCTFDDFKIDQKTVDAVIRNLEIIGEAVKNLDSAIKNDYPQIEWNKITGLRNILIHQYFGINSVIIWDVVQNKLPPLKQICKSALESIT
jgi:uncharacterized protein with HEPN domain